MLKGNVLYGQSGGPSSAINSSALGVILESFAQKDAIERVYMMHHGIVGAINDDLIDVTDEKIEELNKLEHTAGAFFGSIRYKLKSYEESDVDYKKILETLKKHNIRYFFYNGGNDSMDTCQKISNFLKNSGYECRVMGIPKTIDNDLPITDHTPGFATSAKFISNAIIDMSLDNHSYPNGKVIVVEIMGRHAGWLTASSSLANLVGYGPDLIYLPEVAFDLDKFVNDVKKVYEKNHSAIIAVSEGIVDANGDFVCKADKNVDAFGHTRLGGVGQYLANVISEKLGYASVGINLSILQRGASRLASKTDIEEGKNVGREAVRRAVNGETDKMITIIRTSDDPYKVKYDITPLVSVANIEKKVPLSMINDEHNNVTEEFIRYCKPLINGELDDKFKDGLLDLPHLSKYRS